MVLGKIRQSEALPPLTLLFAIHLFWFFICVANPYSLGIYPSLAAGKVYKVFEENATLSHEYLDSLKFFFEKLQIIWDSQNQRAMSLTRRCRWWRTCRWLGRLGTRPGTPSRAD